MEKNEILAVHGTDAAAMARALCEAADLAGLIGDRRKKIGLKPNLVLAAPAGQGATTHPQVAAGVIEYLQAAGFRHISIIEGAWVGAKTAAAFNACGYSTLARRTGVALVDTQQDTYTTHNCAGLAISICDAALAVDFMINLPVMKGHCQTGITCALKNNKGVIPNGEKRRFHAMGLHKPIAHLNTVAKNDFVLVDGICGDLDFEEGGNPVVANRLFAARDAVLCDAFVAREMGFTLKEIPYIAMAEALGVGSANLAGAQLHHLNDGSAAGTAPKPVGKARRLAPYIQQDAACSACYAAVVRALSRMDVKMLQNLAQPVCVGQGWRDKAGAVGVGNCTAGFAKSLAGCPPAAGQVLAFLQGGGGA